MVIQRRRHVRAIVRDMSIARGRRTGIAALTSALALISAGCGSQRSAEHRSASAVPAAHSTTPAAPAAHSTTSAAAGSPSTTSGWVALNGAEVSYSDTALLTQQDQNGPDPLDYYVYGTTSNLNGAVIDPSIGLPAQTSVGDGSGGTQDAESAILTAAQPNHTDGVVIAVVQATTAANGLTAPSTAWYLSQFDAATQAHISTVKITGVPSNWNDVIARAFTSGALDVEADSNIGTFGRVSSTGAFLGTVTAPNGNLTIYTTPTGLALIEGGLVDDSSSDSCDAAWVIDITALKVRSRTPGCSSPAAIPFQANPAEDGGFFNDQAFAMSRIDGVYSTATGQLLSGAPHSTSGQETYVNGPRSDVVVAWDGASSEPIYVLSASTWKTVFTTPGESSTGDSEFDAYGLSDNDVYATAHGNLIVFDAHTGKQLYGAWPVSPMVGGAGWTLCQGVPQDSGEPPQYLLRSSTPLLANLASAPVPSTGPS